MSFTTELGFTPSFSVSKNDVDIMGGFADRLISITINSCDGGGSSDTAEIVIDDRDWAVSAPSIAGSSAVLSVSLGYAENAMYDMGTFQVGEVRFKGLPKKIVIQANSLGANTDAKAPVITAFEGKTLGDIVGSIAQAAGVKATVDPSLSSIAIPYLNVHSSHQHLLQELERRFNGLAKFQDGNLSFTQRGTGLSASGLSVGTFALGPEDLGEWDIQSNNTNAYSKVRASYLDRNLNQLVWLESKVAGNPGSSVPHMMKSPFATREQAQAAADAAMGELNRSSKSGTLTLAKGDPSIRGGQKFTIAGCRDGMDDTYTVGQATHTFNKESGITTSLSFYTEDTGSDTSTGDAPTTAPTLGELAPEASTAPVEGATGTLGH